MTKLKQIESYPVTKTKQSEWASSIMKPLMDGEVDPIEFIVKIKGLSTALYEVEKNREVKELVIREIEKTGKSVSWNGAMLTVRETGVRYDFTGCNDPVYASLLKQKTEIETKMKEREAFLKNVPEDTTVVDEETGECYTLNPAIRTATESYAIQFGK